MSVSAEDRRQADVAYHLIRKAAMDLMAIGIPEQVIRASFAYGAFVTGEAYILDTFNRAVDDGIAGRDPNPPFGHPLPLNHEAN